MITWAYVAGFFDGEGSLHMDRYKSTVQIRIDNTFRRAVQEIRSFVGCGTISNLGRAKPHHKDRFRLTISNHVDVLRILEGMLPYLIVKRRAAEVMIEYIRGKKWRAFRRRRRR
jgi:hypothetical protein